MSISSKLHGCSLETFWREFSVLAHQSKAVNLGQGFPDWPCEDFVKQACCEAVQNDYNQYSRSSGDMSLVQALGNYYSPLICHDINHLNEIAVTFGAMEGLYAIFLSLLQKDDEVIIFEPSFDIYTSQIKLVGAKCVYVPLFPPSATCTEWHFSMEDLHSAITDKTKIILINTPHNPSGKVFSENELIQIAQMIENYPRILVVTDEVYEHLVYNNNKHFRFASISENIWNRTLSVSSAGKTFSITGWKVGWIIGPSNLLEPINYVIQILRNCVTTPCQMALSTIMSKSIQPYHNYSTFFEYNKIIFENKFHKFKEFVIAAGLIPLHSQVKFYNYHFHIELYGLADNYDK